jgi:hypothetical protein
LCSFSDLSCNRDAQPWAIESARFKKDNKTVVLQLAPGSGDFEKFGSFKDSIVLFEGKAHRSASSAIRYAGKTVLTGEAGPALRPTPINYPATCLRRHPFAKSVIPGPLDLAGLKSAFHIINPLYYYKFYFCARGLSVMLCGPGTPNPKFMV